MKSAILKTTSCALILTFTSVTWGNEKISLRTNLFNDNTGTTVQSPAVGLVKDLAGQLEFVLKYTLDRVIIPPIRGLAATPTADAVTGASRPIDSDNAASKSFAKDRNEFNMGLSLPGISGNFYYSTESDYIARMATVSANVDFNQKNTNLSGFYSYGWDDINPLGQDTSYTKIMHAANLTLTQALSPVSIARIGADISVHDGFQTNPYRTVNAGGQILLEKHPLQRTRGSVFLKVNRYFKTETSLNIEYRYYQDDWQVKSHALGFYFHQYFNDKVLIRYRYRYYQQSQAEFYRKTYPSIQSFMTSDYKMEKFNAHLFGFKIEYKLQDLLKDGLFSFMASSNLDFKYERYFTSSDFTADIFQFGLVLNY